MHVFARPGFAREWPEIAGVLTRMWFPLEELQAALERARAQSFPAAARHYVEQNPERVGYWVEGVMPGE